MLQTNVANDNYSCKLQGYMRYVQILCNVTFKKGFSHFLHFGKKYFHVLIFVDKSYFSKYPYAVCCGSEQVVFGRITCLIERILWYRLKF